MSIFTKQNIYTVIYVSTCKHLTSEMKHRSWTLLRVFKSTHGTMCYLFWKYSCNKIEISNFLSSNSILTWVSQFYLVLHACFETKDEKFYTALFLSSFSWSSTTIHWSVWIFGFFVFYCFYWQSNEWNIIAFNGYTLYIPWMFVILIV